MSASNRAAKITQLQKVLKKHYQPVKPPSDRSVLEHLLYACCLEDAEFEQADEAFARLQESYFDWNEVRVTTVNELTESMSCLPDPAAAATRLKSSLHALFEAHYSFDLEYLRKENLGKAVALIEAYKGATPFVIAYVTQHGLGGHSIPIDRAALNLALVVDLITAKEAEKQVIPGLDRAIPKTKGIEFGSLLHQLAVDFHLHPQAAQIRKVVLEIDPSAKDRLPKRGSKGEAGEEELGEQAASDSKHSGSKKGTAKKVAAKKSAGKAPQKKAKKAEPKKETAKAKKKSATGTAKKDVKKKSTDNSAAAAEKKSATKSLSRKKPR